MIRTGFPSETIINEFEFGIDVLLPVVHTIEVAVFDEITQVIPSMVTETVDPKFIPAIVKTVPPTLGPNFGLKLVTVDVFAWEYTTAPAKVISVGFLTTMSQVLSDTGSTLKVE